KNSIFNKVTRFFGENSTLIGLIFMIIIATMINRTFLTATNLSNVLRQASLNGIIAVGMAMVIICGSIDLSVGSLYALCAVSSLYLAQKSVILAIIGTMALGLFVGLLNGLIITKMHIHPWITTLSTMLGIRGVVLVVSNENTYKPEISNPAFENISRGAIFTYLNYPIILFVVVSVIAHLFLTYTPFGRKFYATGGNTEAAKMMGVNTTSALMVSHILCGLTASIAGILVGSRVGVASPLVGDGEEMYAIAACVVGGVYLTGGRGKIPLVFAGSFIIAMLSNVFNLQNNLSPFWEAVITGALVLVVVLIQQINVMRAERIKKISS
ncbi:MAG: ABC transporter permease, partial [Anaerolineaceae bacterium]